VARWASVWLNAFDFGKCLLFPVSSEGCRGHLWKGDRSAASKGPKPEDYRELPLEAGLSGEVLP